MLKSNIINQGAQATANSENAAQLQERQQSGGAPGAAPTGARNWLAGWIYYEADY